MAVHADRVTEHARRALATNRAMLTLGHEVLEVEGAVFVKNPEVPDIWDANHVTAVRASTPDEIDRLLARVAVDYAGVAHRRFDLDATTPPAFEARLVLDEYQRRDFLLMLLDGPLRTRPRPHDVRPIDDEAGWAAYESLKALDWREHAARLDLSGSDDTERGLIHIHRRRAPPMRYWLAWEGGEPCGFLASWGGVEGYGQVEDLFVHPGHRNRGIATALIDRGVTDCLEAGAGLVVIVADGSDTPKHAYAAMGFVPVAVRREYLRRQA